MVVERASLSEPTSPFLMAEAERPGTHSAVVALLQKRQHPLAELGQLGMWPFAAEQIAAKLAFELTDGAGERGLCDIAFLGGAREIERPRYSEEVADLMHFHADKPRCLV